MIHSIRHGRVLGALLVLAALAVTAPAFAKMVDISGKHSKDEIRSACAKVGGINNSGQDGHGYGCYNPKNGTLVACNDEGGCTGYVPGRTAPPNVNDVLKGSGAPTGAADFASGGNGKHGSDTAGTGGGTNGNGGGSGHANMTGDAAGHSGSVNGGIGGGGGVIQ